MSRVVVVGAGMGGLAVAARLARSGHRVTILEQSATWGGKLGWYERAGFAFDTGPSLLTLPTVYRELFSSTGRPVQELVELVPVPGATSYRYPDGTRVELPNLDRTGVVRELDSALGPGTGAAWSHFLDRAERIWDATRGPFLTSPLTGPIDLVRQSHRVSDLRAVAPWRTLAGLGRQYLSDERARMLLWRYATYTGSDPRRAPAALAVVPYLEQAFGSWYVTGGLRRLGTALVGRCGELGVTLQLGAPVGRISISGGRVDGVVLADGHRLAADVVVSDVDAAHLYGELLDPRVAAPWPRVLPALPRGRTTRPDRRTTRSSSGVVLLLALNGRTPRMAHHTVLFGADDTSGYAAEFDALFARDPAPVDRPTIYISAPDDPGLRPDDGHESWFVLVNAAPHGAGEPGDGTLDWRAPGLAERYADHVLAEMAARGLEVRDRLVWRVVRTPADLAEETGAVGGSIYGSSSNGVRSAFLRPANRSRLAGLFLVGGSAHPGGGLPLVALSARIVSDLIGPA
ncbi:MAG: phytoene desaturase family protein [Actinomycetes bacterium]